MCRLRHDEKHEMDVTGVESKGQSAKVTGGNTRGRQAVRVADCCDSFSLRNKHLLHVWRKSDRPVEV